MQRPVLPNARLGGPDDGVLVVVLVPGEDDLDALAVEEPEELEAPGLLHRLDPVGAVAPERDRRVVHRDHFERDVAALRHRALQPRRLVPRRRHEPPAEVGLLLRLRQVVVLVEEEVGVEDEEGELGEVLGVEARAREDGLPVGIGVERVVGALVVADDGEHGEEEREGAREDDAGRDELLVPVADPLRFQGSSAARRAEVDEVVADVADGVAGGAYALDVRVEGIVGAGVGVLEPGGEDAEAAVLAAVLVREEVIGVVQAATPEAERTDRWDGRRGSGWRGRGRRRPVRGAPARSSWRCSSVSGSPSASASSPTTSRPGRKVTT